MAVFSRINGRTPALAREKAIEHPMIPPPTMTTSGLAIGHLLRRDRPSDRLTLRDQDTQGRCARSSGRGARQEGERWCERLSEGRVGDPSGSRGLLNVIPRPSVPAAGPSTAPDKPADDWDPDENPGEQDDARDDRSEHRSPSIGRMNRGHERHWDRCTGTTQPSEKAGALGQIPAFSVNPIEPGASRSGARIPPPGRLPGSRPRAPPRCPSCR